MNLKYFIFLSEHILLLLTLHFLPTVFLFLKRTYKVALYKIDCANQKICYPNFVIRNKLTFTPHFKKDRYSQNLTTHKNSKKKCLSLGCAIVSPSFNAIS
jgi:hypothetical protein